MSERQSIDVDFSDDPDRIYRDLCRSFVEGPLEFDIEGTRVRIVGASLVEVFDAAGNLRASGGNS